MSSHCEVFRVCCYSNNRPSSTGNAFVFNGRLITVRHVVDKAYSNKSKQTIQVKPNVGEGLVECEIFAYDDEAFSTSTLVVLHPKTELSMKHVDEEERTGNSGDEALTKSLQGYTNWTDGTPVDITIKDIKQIPNVSEEDEETLRHPVTRERYNRQIDLGTKKRNYKGLSGSPIYNIRGELCGIFNAQKAENSTAICGYGLCDGLFHKKRKILLEKASQKEKEEAAKKAEAERKATEKSILSFAEYVAEVCDDRPNGLPRLLGNPSEYTSRYPGLDISVHQKRLRAFWFEICNAGREIDIDSAKKIRDQALEILRELYCNSKQILDVYISALYGVLLSAYQERTYQPERMKAIKNLLDVAADDFEKDFPHRHLFLAEYYVASEESREAMRELEEAGKLCLLEWMNTNCYASICILRTCCRTPEGEVLKNETVLSNLAMAIRNRPDVCQFYICNTGAYRMMANYQANCAYFHDAVNSVEYAFGLDSKADSQKGCDDDHECFRSICSKALDYYVHQGFGSYEQWCTFRTYVARSPLYRQSYCGFEVEIQDKWIAALDRWNQNRFDLRGVKGLKYEEAEETEGFNHETFGKLLDQCVNVELFLRVLDLDEQTFEEERESRDKVLCKISGLEEAVSIHKLENDAYLYIHEYKPDGKKTLPVWHLICPQR